MTDPRCAYLIVGNPRTGSTVLARALTETGCMGRPEEYFWRWQEKEWASRFGLPALDEANYAEYVRAALRYGTTSNGVFAAKVFWAHAEDLIRRTADIPHLTGMPGHQRFRRVFADNLRAVFLRRNCLRAAVSLWRAEVSGVWNLARSLRHLRRRSELRIKRSSFVLPAHEGGASRRLKAAPMGT